MYSNRNIKARGTNIYETAITTQVPCYVLRAFTLNLNPSLQCVVQTENYKDHCFPFAQGGSIEQTKKNTFGS